MTTFYDTFTAEAITPITEAELDAWIIELDTAGRQQVSGQLRDTFLVEDANGVERTEVGFCCLGVKCDMDPTFNLDSVVKVFESPSSGKSVEVYAYENGGVDSEEVWEPLKGLSYLTRNALANANDGGHSFKDIAAALNLHRATLLTGGDLHWDGMELTVGTGAA